MFDFFFFFSIKGNLYWHKSVCWDCWSPQKYLLPSCHADPVPFTLAHFLNNWPATCIRIRYSDFTSCMFVPSPSKQTNTNFWKSAIEAYIYFSMQVSINFVHRHDLVSFIKYIHKIRYSMECFYFLHIAACSQISLIFKPPQ